MPHRADAVHILTVRVEIAQSQARDYMRSDSAHEFAHPDPVNSRASGELIAASEHSGDDASAVKFYSPYTCLLVVRCDEAQHRNVWAAATLLTEIRRRVVAIRLVVLTGELVSLLRVQIIVC